MNASNTRTSRFSLVPIRVRVIFACALASKGFNDARHDGQVPRQDENQIFLTYCFRHRGKVLDIEEGEGIDRNPV